MKILLFILFAFSCVAIPSTRSFAETAITLDGTVLHNYFSIQENGKKISCAGPINNRYMSGRAVEIDGILIFITLKEDLKVWRAKLKSSRTAKRKIKALTRIAKLKMRLKKENKICQLHGNSIVPSFTPTPGPTFPGIATPTPVPIGTSTPKPTQTPSAPNASCDKDGNTTKFGIPSGLIGNRAAGGTTWFGNCAGCHTTPWYGRTYTQVKSATSSIGPMLFLKLTNQEIADLTALFNCR